MFIIIKDFYINVIVINKAHFIILTHFFLIIIIEHVDFLINRDFIFKLKQFNILIFLTYIINYNLSRIVIRNNINLLIIFIKYAHLNKMFKYKIEEYFSIRINSKYIIIIN